MGVSLSQVTILAGAFGFGLQCVVNNFVCGLILLFERPIHVGDIVEISDLLAEVGRIPPIRAGTVRTRQGADIIVPKTQLLADKLTNWTLSDKLRRISLPVGLIYGAAPKKVITLLEAGITFSFPQREVRLPMQQQKRGVQQQLEEQELWRIWRDLLPGCPLTV